MTAKKGAAPDKRATVPKTVTAARSVQVEVDRPRKHKVYVPGGLTLTVVDDGQGPPVDDVSKTVWRSYADKINAPRAQKLAKQ